MDQGSPLTCQGTAFGKLVRNAVLIIGCSAIGAPALGAPAVAADQRFVDAPAVSGLQPGFATPPATAQTKASAILAGQPSALDALINAQLGRRSDFSTGTGSANATATSGIANHAWNPAPATTAIVQLPSAATPVVESVITRSVVAESTGRWSIATPPVPTVKPQPFVIDGHRRADAPPALFGTTAIAFSHSSLDTKWHSVANTPLGSGVWDELVASVASADQLGKVEAVNAYVNKRVSFRDDGTGADTWSTATATLTTGHGDCEDYAIAKMQLLVKLGFARDDLYLVVARDLVRRADHALLAVRVQNRMVVLDSGTDTLLDASEAMDYRPIITFSGDREWLHGYRATPVNIASNSVTTSRGAQ